MAPKLLGVAPMPRPKCQRQTRLTMTRAVSGCSGWVIQRASSSRPLASAATGGGGARWSVTFRKPQGSGSSARFRWLPRMCTGRSTTAPSSTAMAYGGSGGEASFNRSTSARNSASRFNAPAG